MLRSALLAALLCSTLAVAGDKPSDPHLLCPNTTAVVRRSVFIHGYLHGYEQGFHLADLDVQFGRPARDIRKSKEAKDVQGYRREFGEKHSFEKGYREGLRVGYADAFAGRTFRAFNQIDLLRALSSPSSEASLDPVFDRGVAMGYVLGQQRGLQDGRLQSEVQVPQPACPAAVQHAADTQTFCTAFVGGYRVGYSDAVVNVGRAERVQAEVRAGK